MVLQIFFEIITSIDTPNTNCFRFSGKLPKHGDSLNGIFFNNSGKLFLIFDESERFTNLAIFSIEISTAKGLNYGDLINHLLS